MKAKLQEKRFVIADNRINTDFITREKELYDQLYPWNVFGRVDLKNYVFNVLIGNAKNVEMHDFYPHTQEVKYAQDDKNTCVLSSLDYDLFAKN